VKYEVSRELVEICQEILSEDYTEFEWGKRSSGDWFQTEDISVVDSKELRRRSVSASARTARKNSGFR